MYQNLLFYRVLLKANQKRSLSPEISNSLRKLTKISIRCSNLRAHLLKYLYFTHVERLLTCVPVRERDRQTDRVRGKISGREKQIQIKSVDNTVNPETQFFMHNSIQIQLYRRRHAVINYSLILLGVCACKIARINH